MHLKSTLMQTFLYLKAVCTTVFRLSDLTGNSYRYDCTKKPGKLLRSIQQVPADDGISHTIL